MKGQNLFALPGRIYGRVLTMVKHIQYKHIAPSSWVYYTAHVCNPDNLIMGEKTNISGNSLIMNTRAKFIMKKWSGAAVGLLVITGGHLSVVGKHMKQVTNKVKDELDVHHRMDQDVVVDEDVWIGVRVTLLSGSHIGRGGVIGSNSVVRGSTPPYGVVIGNPAKLVGFRFTPEEIVEHEKVLYPAEERLPMALLEKNYNKYFLKRIDIIREFSKL